MKVKLKLYLSSRWLMAADWQWENAAAGSAAGLTTVTFTHPLDVVRTRFQGRALSLSLFVVVFVQTCNCLIIFFGWANIDFFVELVNDGRLMNLPSYKNTLHALTTIARTEVCYFGCVDFWFPRSQFRDLLWPLNVCFLLCIYYDYDVVLQWICLQLPFCSSRFLWEICRMIYA